MFNCDEPLPLDCLLLSVAKLLTATLQFSIRNKTKIVFHWNSSQLKHHSLKCLIKELKKKKEIPNTIIFLPSVTMDEILFFVFFFIFSSSLTPSKVIRVFLFSFSFTIVIFSCRENETSGQLWCFILKQIFFINTSTFLFNNLQKTDYQEKVIYKQTQKISQALYFNGRLYFFLHSGLDTEKDRRRTK